MKKLLNISVIAALAALPMAANADITTTDPGATNANAPVAANAPKYSLATDDTTDANLATAGYVKGAYNAAIKAINKVSETARSALQASDVDQTYDATSTNAQSGVAVASAISAAGANYATAAQGAKADTALQASDVDQTYDATSANAQSGVAVASAISAAGANYATAAQGTKADNAETLLGNSAMGTTATTVTGAIAELKTASGDYATKTGVLATIDAATVPVMAQWGSTTATTVSVDAPANFVNQ